jgi:hypothetical protein
LARCNAGRFGRRARRRSRRLPAGRSLVLRLHRRPIPELRDSNILSAQFYSAALQRDAGIPREITDGEFGTLHTWLRDNIYRHGNKFAPNDLIQRATGAAMNMNPYFDYLREKYAALYRLPEPFGANPM